MYFLKLFNDGDDGDEFSADSDLRAVRDSLSGFPVLVRMPPQPGRNTTVIIATRIAAGDNRHHDHLVNIHTTPHYTPPPPFLLPFILLCCDSLRRGLRCSWGWAASCSMLRSLDCAA